jgi:hypothetical protein
MDARIIDGFAMHWADREVEQEDAKVLIFSLILSHPACSTALPSAVRGRGGAVGVDGVVVGFQGPHGPWRVEGGALAVLQSPGTIQDAAPGSWRD